MLIESSGLPNWYASLFITTQARNASKAPNTLLAMLSAVRSLLAWAESRAIVLEERFANRQFLGEADIESLRTFAQSSFAAAAPDTVNVAVISRRLEGARARLPKSDARVSSGTHYIRLTYMADYLDWLTFAASERHRTDDSEYEHYSDSGGKSGGQKEKLAYTILAASLAYQFKLAWAAKRSRRFHFVLIDEAFGRGSDESARYGLELFKQLNLQLLIVTPLQKIHIIEPFVASVGFVSNEGGLSSRLLNLSIAEHLKRKAEGAA
jgi:Putative exonuclease SbcCD, C subunit